MKSRPSRRPTGRNRWRTRWMRYRRCRPFPRGERILPPLHSLDRLIRYETMIDRELLRTIRQLELRRLLRKIEQAPDHPDPANAPAPNEPTATPSAGSATRCERRSNLAGAVPRTGMLHRGFPTLATQGRGTNALRPARPPVLMCCPLHWQQAASGTPAITTEFGISLLTQYTRRSERVQKHRQE